MNISAEEVSRKEFWIKHINASQEFEGTAKEYCQLHGIKIGSLSSYKTKLFSEQITKKVKSKKKSKFTPIQISKPQAKIPMLPDLKWLAEFLRFWISM